MLIGIAYHPYQIPKFRLCQIYIYIKIISNISKLYQIPSLDYKLHKHKDYVWSFSLKFCFFSQLSNNYWWFINVCWMNKCGFGGKRLDNICNSHIKEGLSARLCCQLFGKNQLLIRVNFLRCVPQHLVSWLTKKVAWIFFFKFYLWWILSYIEMKQPWVYMCSPSQSLLPPPSPPVAWIFNSFSSMLLNIPQLLKRIHGQLWDHVKLLILDAENLL